jgi:CRISPR/Cas system CMR-associated protein Cmr5 small subunit
MKKNKQKAIVKEARKVAKQEIKNHIIEALKIISEKFGKGSKKINKIIEKDAIQLAKKLSKEIKFNQVVIVERTAEVPVVLDEKPAPIKNTTTKPAPKKK